MHISSNSKSLRIVIGSLDIGGAEKHLSYILPSLKAQGWGIKIITLTTHVALAAELESKGIIVKKPDYYIEIKSNRFSLLTLCCRIFNVCNSIIRLGWDFIHDRSSITHFFLPEAYVIGMISSIIVLNKSPKIMSRRSLNFYQRKRPFVTWLEHKLHYFSKVIVANSQSIITQLHIKEKVPKDKLCLLYNGIEIDKFTLSNQKNYYSHNVSKSSLTFIIIANLISYKGHVDLFAALGIINSQLPNDWQLLCVGNDSGNIKVELQQYAKHNGINNHINWLGQVTDVIGLLAISDIGILCSHQEGFSNAILEMMASGLPMVVTDVGGNKEAVLDQKNGYVVPARDPEKLSRALLQLSNNPGLRKTMGNASSLRVKQHFNLDLCIRQYNDLYLQFT